MLKGAVFFMADLMRQIDIPCEVDFMAISSYGAGVDSSGVVRILKDLDVSIEGRNVLVVEDIIDSGLTLSYLLRNLEAREPASLEICALLTKPSRREIDIHIRYTGFEIPNKFVIGYGLDFAERTEIFRLSASPRRACRAGRGARNEILIRRLSVAEGDCYAASVLRSFR